MITKYFSTFIMNKITFTLYCFSCISPVSNCYLGHKIPALCFFPKDYCRMLYWKYDEIPSDFVFRFSLNFWNLINSITKLTSLKLNILLFGLSNQFQNYHKKFETRLKTFNRFKHIRFFSNEVSTDEYMFGCDIAINMIYWYSEDINQLEYVGLMTKNLTNIKLSTSNLLKSEYLAIILTTPNNTTFIQQLFIDIVKNSQYKNTKRMNGWISIMNEVFS